MLGNVMDPEDRLYFEARWQAEIHAANRAQSDVARRVHLKLAKAYAQLLADANVRERSLAAA